MTINWIPLTSEADVEQIKTRSGTTPCLIFKHSTRCNISSLAKYRLEDDWNLAPENLEAYFLDILKNRSLSNYVAETFQVYHESPQVLLIVNGECVYDASHLSIAMDELQEALDALNIHE